MLLVLHAPLHAPLPPGQGPIQPAAGSRSVLEDGPDIGPPPSAEARAERVFEVTGTLLIVAILVAALVVVLRQRR